MISVCSPVVGSTTEVFVRDSRATVEDYVASTKHSATYHALLDDGQVYKAYNVYLIPRLLLIDADQVVRFDSAGRNVLAEDIAFMVKELTLSATPDGSS